MNQAIVNNTEAEASVRVVAAVSWRRAFRRRHRQRGSEGRQHAVAVANAGGSPAAETSGEKMDGTRVILEVSPGAGGTRAASAGRPGVPL